MGSINSEKGYKGNLIGIKSSYAAKDDVILEGVYYIDNGLEAIGNKSELTQDKYIKNIAEMKTQSTFSEFDFENTWEITENRFPTLKSSNNVYVSQINAEDMEVGRGDEKQIQLSFLPEIIDDAVFKYSIDNEEIATISNEGIVYGLKEGNTTISIETLDENISKIINLTVTGERTVIGTWDISATSADHVIATLYNDGELIILGNGNMINRDYYIDDYFPWAEMKDRIITINVENGVTNIGYRAFDGCANLTDINIPDSVLNIGSFMCNDCNNLKSINVSANNSNYCSENGILFNKDKTILICYPAQKTGSNYAIPLGVINIDAMAFYGHDHLENIEIPESVQKIGNLAFCNCSNLTNINIPDSIQSIGENAFNNCELVNICVSCSNTYALEYVQNNYSTKLQINHIEAIDNRIEPTCTTSGKTEGKHCSVCNKVLIAQEEIPAKGHDYNEWVTTKEATCIETGAKERTCSRCSNKETESIAVKGHNYSDIVTNPTCTERGYTTHICTRCNDSHIDSYVDAIGHNYIIKSTTDAVCEQGGKIVYECLNCKHSYEETIEAKGHTEVIDSRIEPTCTTKGKTEGKHCSVCNKVLIAQEEIPAKGHSFGEWNTIKEANCTEDGIKERQCSACEEKETEVITKLGHNYETVITAPTCTEQGYTTHTCTKCNNSFIDNYVDAIGHSFGEWIIDKEATYEEDGHKYRVCTHCNNEREEQDIPKLIAEATQITTTYTIKEKDEQKYIFITIGTTVEEAINNIKSNKEIEILGKNGQKLDERSIIGTGAKIQVEGEDKVHYTAIIKGDINGDGNVDFINDVVLLNNYRIKRVKLDTASILAGDIDENNQIDFINDIVRMNNYRLNRIHTL